MVMVVLLLSLLVVMASSRTTLFNESFTGNESDYARALEAAQLLVADATADLADKKPDDTQCAGAPCRSNTASEPQFPTSSAFVDISDTRASVQGNPVPCKNGICTSMCPSAQVGICDGIEPRFWLTPAALAIMTPLAASYGQFTGANPGATGNPILTSGRAWYWTEIIDYNQSMLNASPKVPNSKTLAYVFRITAVAQGAKPGTQAVVQSIVSPRK